VNKKGNRFSQNILKFLFWWLYFTWMWSTFSPTAATLDRTAMSRWQLANCANCFWWGVRL